VISATLFCFVGLLVSLFGLWKTKNTSDLNTASVFGTISFGAAFIGLSIVTCITHLP